MKHDARYYLGKLYFYAVAYGSEDLGFVSDVIARSERYTGGTAKDRSTGSKRMLFGTDHPFFPPLAESDKWASVVENLEAIDNVDGWTEEAKAGVKGGNALEIFGLA